MNIEVGSRLLKYITSNLLSRSELCCKTDAQLGFLTVLQCKCGFPFESSNSHICCCVFSDQLLWNNEAKQSSDSTSESWSDAKKNSVSVWFDKTAAQKKFEPQAHRGRLRSPFTMKNQTILSFSPKWFCSRITIVDPANNRWWIMMAKLHDGELDETDQCERCAANGFLVQALQLNYSH